MKRCVTSVALAGGLVLAAEALAGAPVLQPYRAVYDLVLQSADTGTAITEAQGRLVVEWSDDCTGYAQNQRFVTRLLDPQGRETVHDFSASTWESRDGTRFRFSARNDTNGQEVEITDGEARLDRSGGSGSAVYTQPERRELILPPGTMFPTAHGIRVIEAADAGDRTVAVKVFDGSGEAGLYDTFAVIGDAPGDAPLPPEADPAGLTRDIAAWWVRVSYFAAPGSLESEAGTRTAVELPEMELGFTLFANGIPANLLLDYGDLALSGRLRELEPLPMPRC